MNIVLLCKLNETTAGIATYLVQRGHLVTRTDDKMSAEYLKGYDIGISYNYRHILKQDQIDAVKLGIVNFHTGHLPEQRGAAPNVWAVANGFGGCTCHWIDSGLDTGPLIMRIKIIPLPTDTAGTFYETLARANENLFYEIWPAIEACGEKGIKIPSWEQDNRTARTYKMKDVFALDDIDQYGSGKWMVDRLRSRTFPPHEAMYFTENGKRYYVRVSIEEAK